MLPKCIIVASLFLLMSPLAIGQDANAFEFPPIETPIVAPIVSPVVVDLVEPVLSDLVESVVVDPATPADADETDADEADSEDQTPRDWSAFLQNFLIPLITMIVGLFGGGLGVRFQKRRARRKKENDADRAETGRILSMLSDFVPQLHNKVVLGDAEARKRNAALVTAKKALDEAISNGA